MAKEDIEVLRKNIADLEKLEVEARARVKTATERRDIIEKELNGSTDLMVVKALKGDTEDEKQDSFDKAMKEFGDAHKSLGNIGKRLKAFGKSLKAAMKDDDDTKGKKSWQKTNVNFGGGAPASTDDERGFDWKGISIPWRYKTLSKPPRIGFRKAYAMGQVAIAQLPNGVVSSKAQQYAKDFVAEITKTTGEAFNETGGAFIPIGFYPFLIELINSYGVVRRNVPLWPMKDSTLRVPRDSSLLAVYGEDENQANATESTLNSSTVQLLAKKYMGTISVPREIIEDSPIAFGAVISNKYAKSMAKKEDQAFLLGDGTATYNRTFGVIYQLQNMSGGTAASIYTSASTTFANMTRKDIINMMAGLAAYAVEDGDNKFYASQVVYQILLRGNAISQSTFGTEVVNGIPQYKFDGIPIEITNVMAQTDAASQVCLLYGNLGMAGKMGDKRAYALDASDQAGFTKDQIVFRASERIAQLVHDLGTYAANTSTAFDTVYGPVAALQSAAS